MLTTDDRQQIAETLARQVFLADDNESDRFGEVFTQDVAYDMSSSGMGVFRSLDAVKTAAGRLFASGRAPLSHFVTGVVITEVEESTASVRSKGLMIMHDGGVHGVVYDDVVVRQEGRWLIAKRVIVPLRPAAGAERA